MAEEKMEKENCCQRKSPKRFNGGMGEGVFGLAFIGAAVYFIQHAPTFWLGVLGFLKALVWPALLVYKLLESLNM